MYTVYLHDSTDDLDYAGSDALALSNGSVVTGSLGIAMANLTLPAPGTPGSLAYTAEIRLDGAPATVVSVLPSASTYGGIPVTLGAGDRMDIDVAFDRPVRVSTAGGTPYLLLRIGDDERAASYVANEQVREGVVVDIIQETLTFRYEVGTGEFADALEYASRSALVANGSVITGGAGFPADLTLPSPGARGSLSASSAIAVRAPTAVVDLPPAPTHPGSAPPAPRNVTVAIGSDAAAGPINATDGGNELRLVLNMTGLAAGATRGNNNGSSDGGDRNATGANSGTLTFPPNEVVVITSFAEVSFPPSVNATNVPDDGLLALHITSSVPDDGLLQDALSYGGSGRIILRTVVEVGDEDARVQFDMPVRISLEGQAGGRAFYIGGGEAGGAIVPIDRICAADDTGRVHRQLGGAGECQLDLDGDKVIHTYHMTRFGTAASESGTPPPSYHTCSVRTGSPSLDMQARPGAHSSAAPQELVNSGTLPLASVGIDASPWYIDLGDTAPAEGHPSLPASLTEVSADGPGAGYVEVGSGGEIGAASGLAGGQELPLWFRIDLTGHSQMEDAEIVQHITYQALCGYLP